MVLCGIDEAGRGPLAGPVCAAAVILQDNFPFQILNDSKKLTKLRRAEAEKVIKAEAVAWALGWASPQEIDSINILQASLLAMERAVFNLSVSADKYLVDGNKLPRLPGLAEAIVKGDSLIHEIMAASILAKTARDRLMEEYEIQYPGYGFAQHKGYPTGSHYASIKQHGPCPVHRKSFRLY